MIGNSRALELNFGLLIELDYLSNIKLIHAHFTSEFYEH